MFCSGFVGNDAVIVKVADYGEAENTLCGMYVRNVRYPLDIWSIGNEAAIQQVLIFMYLLSHILVLLPTAYLRQQAIFVHYPQYRLLVELQGFLPHKPYLNAAVPAGFTTSLLAYLYQLSNCGILFRIRVRKLTPIQMPHIDLDEVKSGREAFTKDEWINILLRSTGMEPDLFSYREKWLLLTRMLPLVENNFNLCELGPRSTGKSHLYKEISPNSILVSGGQTTVANLFYNMATKQVGLVGLWDCVAFDEVAGITFKDKDGVQIMKDYRVSHFLFIVVFKSVLCEQNLILEIGVGHFDTLSVTVTHSHLFSTIGSLVTIDFTLHTSSTNETVIYSTKLL